MLKTFRFEVLTPERVFYSNDVDMVIFNTPDGEMGVMADHMPIVTAVNVGVLRMKHGDEEEIAAIGEGFIEVTMEGVTAIVDSAEWPDEIDIDRAIQAKERAQKILKEKKNETEMELMLIASIDRANTRIKIAKKA
jgi:F-type H+-transporting ATPase subunit epsilon